MNKYINQFEAFLTEDEWGYDRKETADRLYLTSGYRGDHCRLDVVFDAVPEKDFVMCFAYMPIMVPKECCLEVAELVCRLNSDVGIGNFEYDFADGVVRFKVAMDMEGGELTPTMIRNMRSAALGTADQKYPAFMRLLFAGQTPEQAMAKDTNDESPIPQTLMLQ